MNGGIYIADDLSRLNLIKRQVVPCHYTRYVFATAALCFQRCKITHFLHKNQIFSVGITS